MHHKLIFPILFGSFGLIFFCGLGIWQLQRLAWKTEILTNIEIKIVAEPDKLPEELSEEKDQYLSVLVSGIVQPQEIHILTSLKNIGPGFLVISPLELPGGKVIMVDRGFIPEAQKNALRRQGKSEIIGNLLWPNEIDSFTPDPNMEKNIWFGRDLKIMSEHLGTDPVLVIARSISPDDKPLPQRVGVHIANNHLSYAITWFSLACVWFGMTILLINRMKKHQI